MLGCYLLFVSPFSLSSSSLDLKSPHLPTNTYTLKYGSISHWTMLFCARKFPLFIHHYFPRFNFTVSYISQHKSFDIFFIFSHHENSNETQDIHYPLPDCRLLSAVSTVYLVLASIFVSLSTIEEEEEEEVNSITLP